MPSFAWRIRRCFKSVPSDKQLEQRIQGYLTDNFYVFQTSTFHSDQALHLGGF